MEIFIIVLSWEIVREDDRLWEDKRLEKGLRWKVLSVRTHLSSRSKNEISRIGKEEKLEIGGVSGRCQRYGSSTVRQPTEKENLGGKSIMSRISEGGRRRNGRCMN